MQNCKRCGYKKWLPTDEKEKVIIDGREYLLRYFTCKRCGELQLQERPFVRPSAKVYYFDIEYAPGTAYYYQRKTDYINTGMLKDKPYIICWAGAFVKEGEFQQIESYCMTQDEILNKRGDRRILEPLLVRLELASHVVGHNVDGFDIKKVNGRFMQLDMRLVANARTIDTLKLTKKYCPQESNGLGYIGENLLRGGKKDIGMDDWIRIVETGDPATLLKAEEYCRHDVRLGIDWYVKLKNKLEDAGVRVVK